VGEMLGQQELMESPPTRRIIVPLGHGAAWGIDPSSVRVSAAYAVNLDGGVARAARTASFDTLKGAPRLAAIYRETRDFVADELATHFPAPGIVHVEQPSGKSENLDLVYACGVIQAAVVDGLWAAYGRPVQVETVVSAHWKLVACGRGNIYKTQRVPGKVKPVPVPLEEYGVMVWARANGYRGFSWDEADALGIAEAARREVALEQR
jgi:hypothetical protein